MPMFVLMPVLLAGTALAGTTPPSVDVRGEVPERQTQAAGGSVSDASQPVDQAEARQRSVNAGATGVVARDPAVDDTVNDIVVTAQRREENAQRTSLAITALT